MDLSISKTVVAGGSGFLGKELISRLISMGRKNIVSVSRNEGSAVALKELFPSITTIVGDIADPWIVKKAMANADEVYLLSALKHVNIAENDVRSCMQTNVVGTMNVIEESLKSMPRVLVFISSDKAATGTSIYGMSKKIGEKLMLEASKINTYTKYRVVRYGNVARSTGSVLCKWEEKMKRGEEIVVTDLESTRFYWSVQQAVSLIFDSIDKADGAMPYITSMKSIRLGDLLEVMQEKYGKSPVKVIGLQSGENKHELIIPEWPDSFHAERFTKDEILQLI